jgi:hypothetical protein
VVESRVTSVDLRSFLVFHVLKVSFEAVESLIPELPVRLDPGVDLAEAFRPQPVHAPLRVDADVDEARIAEHAEVLRDRGLAHRQLVDELADRPLAISQQVEDAAAIRFGEELERGDHGE